MTYNVINTSPTMATNTTHLNDFLTSACMSCLDLSNRSVRHLLVYGARADSLQFSKPPIWVEIKVAGAIFNRSHPTSSSKKSSTTSKPPSNNSG
jgi:hypothetical protein